MEAYDTPIECERFTIDSAAKANWAIRKIADTKREADRYKAFWQAEIERVAEAAANDCLYFEAMLREYIIGLPDEAVHTTKTGIRKMKLPDGELELKPAGIDYERDNEQLLAWAKLRGTDYYRTKEEPAWAAIKAYIKDTGDIPDGVEPYEVPPKLTVKTGG